jgi:uncharacterized protein (TIGR03435 family)
MSSSLGQTSASANDDATSTQYAFDVVSIRQSAKEGYSHWRTGTEGYSATNVTARQMIFYAYTQTDDTDALRNIISFNQIRGLPKWADSQQFDVIAKIDSDTASQLSGFSERDRRNMYQQMLQAVLVERCHLAIRYEALEQPVYLLQISKQGSKLIESNVPFGKSSLSAGHGQIQATGYKIGELVGELAESTGRFVVDQTHLTGEYNFQLRWRPDGEKEATNADPSIYTAVKEQLGLMLVPSKAPVGFIEVTHLDPPTPN